MSALDDELDAKYPLPDIPFQGELTARAKQRTYETERHDWHVLHPHRDGKDEAPCPARNDPTVKHQLKHRWNAKRTACVFCKVRWSKLYG